MRLVFVACTLLVTSFSAAQTPTGFAKGIGPVTKIEKPDFKRATAFRAPDLDFENKRVPPAMFLLPRGCRPGNESHIFVGTKGAFVSINTESWGDQARRQYKERSSKPAEQGVHLVSAGIAIGGYEEHMLRDNVRMGRLYAMVTPEVFYTMMISWPAKDIVAKRDAFTLAQFVIWSFKLKNPPKR